MIKTGLFLLLCCSALHAEELNFSKAVPVSWTKPGMFYHLDGSGRKHIAFGQTNVAVVWEDNRTGKPQVFTAVKSFNATTFSKALRLSDKKVEAYEPTLLAIDKNTFLYGWEQSQHVWLTTVTNHKAGPAIQLDQHPSSQVSLAKTANGKIYAAWIQRAQRQQQLVISELNIQQKKIQATDVIIVDSQTPRRLQSYPSLVAVNNNLVIGWEDRQHGHTRIYTSYSTDGKSFVKKQVLNDFVPPPNPKYGRGTGATRVALASDHEQKVIAVWMDKRDFRGGYDIYAAVSINAGKSFGVDEKAQDMLGENIPQWHPAIAMSSNNAGGKILAAWDDPRDDNPDIWYAIRTTDGWSDDETPSPASGDGAQTSPAIAYDSKGRLHMLWLQQTSHGTALHYSYQQ